MKSVFINGSKECRSETKSSSFFSSVSFCFVMTTQPQQPPHYVYLMNFNNSLLKSLKTIPQFGGQVLKDKNYLVS